MKEIQKDTIEIGSISDYSTVIGVLCDKERISPTKVLFPSMAI